VLLLLKSSVTEPVEAEEVEDGIRRRLSKTEVPEVAVALTQGVFSAPPI